MNQQRFDYLHKQYINDLLNSKEQTEWKAAIEDPVKESHLRELMQLTWKELKQQELNDMAAVEAEQIMTEILGTQQLPKISTLRWSYISIAASIILIALTSIWFYKLSSNDKPVTASVFNNDVEPGSNGATLILSDGRKISLNEIKSGKLAEDGNINITKTADGEIIYELKSNGQKNPSRWNTLSTANGQTCKVHLPDGSVVWLNSASTISYPSNFAGAKTRQLELTGEAYFSISKNPAQPFVVNSAGQEIRVLGTQFNVNSYADEPYVHTTLVEGLVSINNRTKLAPGQQARFDGKETHVLQVNTESFTDWKNGILSFDNERIYSVMRKIARWYNVEVRFKNNDKNNKTYSGTISRTKSISSVLKVLEESEGIHFEVAGRVVTVIN